MITYASYWCTIFHMVLTFGVSQNLISLRSSYESLCSPSDSVAFVLARQPSDVSITVTLLHKRTVAEVALILAQIQMRAQMMLHI